MAKDKVVKEKPENKDYVNNKMFLEYLREYELLDDNTDEWFLKRKPKNENQEAFQAKKKLILQNRIKILDDEDDDARQIRENKLRIVKNKIGRIFILIAKGFLQKPNFINYDPLRKDDMLSDATFFMTQYIDRYDTERTNPFAYFSQIAYWAFLQNINKINKRGETFQALSYVENLNVFDDDFNDFD